MSHTRRKFDEANFFLQRMGTHFSDHPEFDYYLNAFISSARSVLWVMRTEYHAVDGWENWFSTKQVAADEQELLRKVNDIRVRSVKTQPLETRFVLIVDIPADNVNPEMKSLLTSGGERFMVAPMKISSNGTMSLPDGFPIDEAIVGKSVGFERHLDEFPDENIVNVCTRYLKFLEDVVAECEVSYVL